MLDKSEGVVNVVCDNTKILICKQFTTIFAENPRNYWLFAIIQRY